MKNYAEMGDFEINVAVASALGVAFETHEQSVYVSIKRDGENVVSVAGAVDHCNNWADAGPVMLENRIGIYPSEGPDFMPWMASPVGLGLLYTDKNPLRAAMIVFLMMKDNETRILAPGEVSDE